MKNQLHYGIAVALMFAFNVASAQIPQQWERTLQFEGVWSGLAELNLGGQIFNVVYNTDFKLVIDGNGMTMDEGFSDPNLGELKGANLIGYSPTDDQIHWFSVDNFGTAHEHTGTWLNPRHFYMVHQSVQGGLVFAEYIHFRMRANNTRIVVTLVATLGPDTIQTIEGTLYKQTPSNRLASNESNTDSELSVYPNPASGNIYIESAENIEAIRVVNSSGQLVYEANPGSDYYELQLDMDGLYFIEVRTAEETVTEKVVIRK